MHLGHMSCYAAGHEHVVLVNHDGLFPLTKTIGKSDDSAQTRCVVVWLIFVVCVAVAFAFVVDCCCLGTGNRHFQSAIEPARVVIRA